MCEQREPTYEGFIEFITKADPSKEVNHNSWDSCLVGDYMEFCGATRTFAWAFANEVIKETHPALHAFLNGGVYVRSLTTRWLGEFDTYGAVVGVLKEYKIID